MPSNRIARNLHLCLFKIGRSPSTSPTGTPNELGRPFPAAGAALVKNFNSLYDGDEDEDSAECDANVDLAAILASRRFFVSSPGRSNSIVDSSSPTESDWEPSVGGAVAVTADSPDPYADFRRSMEEMVEAREVGDVRANWEYLQELLLCYLALNPKSTHRFIVGAFADLILCHVSADGGGSRLGCDFAGGICNIRSG